ncbi:MAG: hypothetical protein GXY17_11980 [Clostridiaceae bacterium]|jgi:hypothetical protein|nr:hypothetical protein [Clostridiaceae bacterium]
MNKRVIEWLRANNIILDNMGIQTENIRESPKDSIDQGVTVEHASEKCLGQISIWESGLMDIEVVEIESESRVLYEHYELDQNADFTDILKQYFEIMKNGKV